MHRGALTAHTHPHVHRQAHAHPQVLSMNTPTQQHTEHTATHTHTVQTCTPKYTHTEKATSKHSQKDTGTHFTRACTAHPRTQNVHTHWHIGSISALPHTHPHTPPAHIPQSVCSPQRRALQPRAPPALLAPSSREKPAERLPQPPAPPRVPPALRPSPHGEARPHSKASRWRRRSSWRSRGRTTPTPSRPGPARLGPARPRGAASSLSRTGPCLSASPAAAMAPLSCDRCLRGAGLSPSPPL